MPTADRLFLLYLAHHNPHIPTRPRLEQVATHVAAFEPVYAVVIEALDNVAGRLLAKLDALGARGAST